MKIFLKADWDYQPSYEEAEITGHFAGRQQEKEELVDEFLRKDNGSILVSGARGVGKTSLLFQSLKEAKKDNHKITPVVLNASQLDLYGGHSKAELPKIVIENLIRRLYGNFQSKKVIPDDLYNKLGELYKKTIAKEYNASELVQSTNEEREADDDTSEKNSDYTFDKSYFLNIFYLIGIFCLFVPPIWTYFVNQFLAIFFLLLPTFSFKYLKKVTKKISKNITSTNTAESLYKIDASLGNLEHELNTLLKLFAREGIKIIFVIDELDKIESEDNPDYIFEVIKTFKNLFTLSSALFIFITSDQAYRKIIEGKKSRKSHYTLFTNRIFINRPSFKDLDDYINDIILKIEVDGQTIDKDFDKQLEGDSKRRFKDFKNYLCFKSRSDYFDLSLIIRDYINSYQNEDGQRLPIIELPKLKTTELLQSKTELVVEQIFDINRVQEQSEWHQNDLILSGLYDFLENNLGRPSFEVDLDNEKPIIKDYFIPYLERLEIINRTSTRTSDPDKVETVNFGVYQWTGKIPGEGRTPDVPNSPQQLFEVERKFIEIAKKYVQVVNDLDDLDYNSEEVISGEFKKQEYQAEDYITESRDAEKLTGLSGFNIFSKYEDYVDGLSQEYPQHFNRQELEDLTKELGEEYKKYKDIALNYFTNLFKNVLTKKSVAFSQDNLQNDPSLLEPISDLRNGVINGSFLHSVIFRTEPMKSKQLLITFNLDPSILSQDVIKLLHENNSYRLLNIQTNPDLNYSKKNEFEARKTILNKRKKPRIYLYTEKTEAFKNVHIADDFTILAPIVQNLFKWFTE